MAEFALYTNPKGQPVTHSSYSARQTFKKCPRQFQLERVHGWSDKERRAAPIFGKCIEAGAQYHEENNRRPGTAVERFSVMWAEVKGLPEFGRLVYTDTEGDYESLARAGREMMRLYEIRAPFLPISVDPKALWQQTLRKKLFPGTDLDKLENKAILDLISFPRWDHPMLPKIASPVIIGSPPGAGTRPLIVDIKTSGEDLDTDLIGLDPQLTEYAWESRIPDVAFLWFVKKSHGYKKGSRVTLLENAAPFYAGFELLVLMERKDSQVCLGDYETFAAYEKHVKDVKGKALEIAKAEFCAGPKVITINPCGITKQRLQFAAAHLTESDMNESGRDVAQTTVEMVRAHNEDYYPKLAGVRFPNQKCNFCSMRWICLNRPDERDQYLTRKGEEWLDGIEEE